MNVDALKSAISYVKKECKCSQCNSKYKNDNISMVAATKTEVLVELNCPKCAAYSLITVYMDGPPSEFSESDPAISERTHSHISQDDVLDIKNFLNTFDGNFKKIFSNKQ